MLADVPMLSMYRVRQTSLNFQAEAPQCSELPARATKRHMHRSKAIGLQVSLAAKGSLVNSAFLEQFFHAYYSVHLALWMGFEIKRVPQVTL